LNKESLGLLYLRSIAQTIPQHGLNDASDSEKTANYGTEVRQEIAEGLLV